MFREHNKLDAVNPTIAFLSTSEFHLREIPKREVRTLAGKVRKILERYKTLGAVTVSEITEV
jgi:hypothetical protein